MINRVMLAGELEELFEINGKYFIKLKVEEQTIECSLWEGVYEVLLEKPVGSMVAVMGSIKNNNGILSVNTERVSLITENE